MSTNLYGIYFKWPKEAICFNFKIVNIQTMCWGWIWWGSYPLTLSQNGSPASICWLTSYQRAISREHFDIGPHKSFNKILRLTIIISHTNILAILLKVADYLKQIIFSYFWVKIITNPARFKPVWLLREVFPWSPFNLSSIKHFMKVF